MFQAAVITVSDKGFAGMRKDGAGPAAAEMLREAGYEVVHTQIIPDERADIERTLVEMADARDIPLVITTGGTGFSPRDVTPEATVTVCERLVPGIPEAMRAASMQVTSRAMLSRMAAGIRRGTLIINLPGSPKAARENLATALPALAHGLEILRGTAGECATP